MRAALGIDVPHQATSGIERRTGGVGDQEENGWCWGSRVRVKRISLFYWAEGLLEPTNVDVRLMSLMCNVSTK